jgi:hypothetical protein
MHFSRGNGTRSLFPVSGEWSRIMTRQWIAVLAAIWLTAIASAVLLIAQISHQRYVERPAREMQAESIFPTQQADEPVVDNAEPATLVMPTVTIVAPSLGAPGVAEMQGTGQTTGARPDDLVIGPGTVTHPVAIPPAPTARPER